MSFKISEISNDGSEELVWNFELFVLFAKNILDG